jgi:hypothetical protein
MAAMPKLAAEQQMAAIEAASVPHLADEKVRSRIFARLKRRIAGEKPKTAAEALATLPIPVVHEPVKGGES